MDCNFCEAVIWARLREIRHGDFYHQRLLKTFLIRVLLIDVFKSMMFSFLSWNVAEVSLWWLTKKCILNLQFIALNFWEHLFSLLSHLKCPWSSSQVMCKNLLSGVPRGSYKINKYSKTQPSWQQMIFTINDSSFLLNTQGILKLQQSYRRHGINTQYVPGD